MLTITVRQDDYLELAAAGKITEDDYKDVLPQLEAMFECHESLRMLLRLRAVEGFSVKALLEGLKFDLDHRDGYSKIAILGSSKMHELLSKTAGVFFKGEVRYFDDSSDESIARRWLGAPPDRVEEAGEASFPASDPPNWGAQP